MKHNILVQQVIFGWIYPVLNESFNLIIFCHIHTFWLEFFLIYSKVPKIITEPYPTIMQNNVSTNQFFIFDGFDEHVAERLILCNCQFGLLEHVFIDPVCEFFKVIHDLLQLVSAPELQMVDFVFEIGLDGFELRFEHDLSDIVSLGDSFLGLLLGVFGLSVDANFGDECFGDLLHRVQFREFGFVVDQFVDLKILLVRKLCKNDNITLDI